MAAYTTNNLGACVSHVPADNALTLAKLVRKIFGMPTLKTNWSIGATDALSDWNVAVNAGIVQTFIYIMRSVALVADSLIAVYTKRVFFVTFIANSSIQVGQVGAYFARNTNISQRSCIIVVVVDLRSYIR
jgi:hypothetical protein